MLYIHDTTFDQTVSGTIETPDELRIVGDILDSPVKDIGGVAGTEYVGGLAAVEHNGLRIITIYRVGSQVCLYGEKAKDTSNG